MLQIPLRLRYSAKLPIQSARHTSKRMVLMADPSLRCHIATSPRSSEIHERTNAAARTPQAILHRYPTAPWWTSLLGVTSKPAIIAHISTLPLASTPREQRVAQPQDAIRLSSQRSSSPSVHCDFVYVRLRYLYKSFHHTRSPSLFALDRTLSFRLPERRSFPSPDGSVALLWL
jgi:hypothetical protein